MDAQKLKKPHVGNYSREEILAQAALRGPAVLFNAQRWLAMPPVDGRVSPAMKPEASVYEFDDASVGRELERLIAENAALKAKKKLLNAPKHLIFTLEKSTCCRSRMILVRSRAGNFVSKNCLRCGKSDHVFLGEIPGFNCEHCQAPNAVVSARLIEKNYTYICSRCDKHWTLGEMVPEWSDLFSYWGLSAPGGAALP